MKPQQINSLGDVFKHIDETSQIEILKAEINRLNNNTDLHSWADLHVQELDRSSELKKVLRNKLAEVRKANYSGVDREYFESLKYQS